MAFPHTAAVIGLGLIGGSLAFRLRAIGVRVIGIDVDPNTLAAARTADAIDDGSDSLGAAAAADLVIVATPVDRVAQTAIAVGRELRPGTVLTDVASVKAPVVSAVEPGLPAGVLFVGGHPIAGSEGRGFAAADPSLLDGRPFVLTPTPRTAPDAVARMRVVVARLGMRPVLLDPAQHDELVAQISHVPYLISVALRRAAAGDAQAIAGRSFADMTRIARSPTAMWAAICRENRAPILRALASFETELARLRGALETGRIVDTLPVDDADAAYTGLPMREGR